MLSKLDVQKFIKNNSLHGCNQGDRVVVAMSGGVDSSVVAALCSAWGYEVVGITMKLYDTNKTSNQASCFKSCCGVADINDARRVCDKLEINHYVIDYESRFKQSVIDDFVDSYLRGETPIPCIKCNQELKFNDLMEFSKQLGAKALITGHYVRKVGHDSKAQLHKAVDTIKDQSYFMFATTNEQLQYSFFPLGELQKSETREVAEYFGLKIAKKPESQDICFVGGRNYAEVVRQYRPDAGQAGDIINKKGEVLGQHKGIEGYTIGQRRGLGLGNITGVETLYVIKIDQKHNRVIVGTKDELTIGKIHLKNMNWLSDVYKQSNLKCSIKIRSTMSAVNCRVRPLGESDIEVVFEENQYGVARGQAGVIYDDSRVLGGGWIA